jgi:hypothetical protein
MFGIQLVKTIYICKQIKKLQKWLTLLVMIVLLAAPVLTSAPWKLSPKVTSIKSIPIHVPIAVHAPMFALLKQFTLHKHIYQDCRKSLSA